MAAQHQTQQQRPAQATSAGSKSLLDQVLERPVEYKPFMSDEPIRLTIRMVLDHFARPTKKGARCSEQQAMRFIMLCKSRGLNPWEGDAFIVGYDTEDGPEFNLITAHQAMLKRAEVHPEYDGMQSGVTIAGRDGVLMDLDGVLRPDGTTLMGGWARVHFKNRKHPMYKRLALATYDKKRSRWKDDPGGMIVKCAQAASLRESFPNTLGGMYLREEFDSSESVIERTPVRMPQSIHEMQAAENGGGDISDVAQDDVAQDDGSGEQETETLANGPSPEAIKAVVAELNAKLATTTKVATVRNLCKEYTADERMANVPNWEFEVAQSCTDREEQLHN